MNMLTRGVLRAVTQTTRGFRTLSAELLDDEPDTIQHFEVHGLHSTPQNGAPVLAMQMSGNADHLVALVAGDYRGPAISAGESVVYNDHDWSLRMLETGVSVSDGATARLVVTTVAAPGGMLGVARALDAVSASAEFGAWVTLANTKLNALPGGTMPPFASVGVISDASSKVFVEAG
jgi:phage gp45-like